MKSLGISGKWPRRRAAIAIFPFLILNMFFGVSSYGARLKDLASVEGFRANQLIGYGLVVGLNGTGDKQNTEFTVQTLTNLLQEYSLRVKTDDVKVKNVASVMVTAEVPPFAQAGTRIDAIVSSIGDASSLSGGVLLLTPLKGPDGRVYAVGQGPVSLGGGYTAIGIGAKISKDHQTAGRITGGALLERPVTSPTIAHNGEIRINLAKPDFTTAKRMAEALTKWPLEFAAQATSPGVVSVLVPEIYKNNEVDFISALESVEITPDNPARVVVNERTGTVIISRDVRIAPVAVAHAGLHITIKTELKVSQPNPFGRGQTAIVPDTGITIKEPENRQLVEIAGAAGVSLSDLVNALNALGVTPRDLIAVFEALREAGALQAELVVM